MKKIEEVFNKYGHTFKQVKRKGNVALYERTFEDGSFVCYEVIVIRTLKKDNTLTGGKVGDESYPGNEAFGKYGWTIMTIERAEEKYNELVARYTSN